MSWRRWLFRIHMMCGIILGIFFAVMGLSGSLLVYHDQIDAALNPGLTNVSASYRVGSTMAETMLQASRSHHPGWNLLELDGSAQSSWAFYLSPSDWNAQSQIRIEYFDPGSMRFLGERGLRQGKLNWLMQFHTNLLRGSQGPPILGGLAVVLLLLTFTGLLLWWPGADRVKTSFGITRGVRWPRKVWDLHRSIGLLSGAWLLLEVSTALCLAIPAVALTFVPYLTGSTGADLASWGVAPQVSPPTARATSLTLDDLLGRASARHPHLQFESVMFPADRDGAVLFTFGGPRFESRGEQAQVALNQYDGSVASDLATDTGSRSLRVYAAIGPWHFGHFAGAWSRIAWIVLGLTPTLLFFTGFLMWWVRCGHRRLFSLTRRHGSFL